MICQGCGCIFCPDQIDVFPNQESVQLYCRQACRKMAGKRRTRQRYLCALQGKICYPSAEAALHDMRVLKAQAHVHLTSAYECIGHWHTTSQPLEHV